MGICDGRVMGGVLWGVMALDSFLSVVCRVFGI